MTMAGALVTGAWSSGALGGISWLTTFLSALSFFGVIMSCSLTASLSDGSGKSLNSVDSETSFFFSSLYSSFNSSSFLAIFLTGTNFGRTFKIDLSTTSRLSSVTWSWM